MTELKEIKNYNDLHLYLFMKKPDAFDEGEKSNANKSFTKGTVWWYWVNECRTNVGKEILKENLSKTIDAISKDF